MHTIGRLTLTGRERQVLDLVARGRTNAQIARELGIAVSTVRSYLAHIFDVTGVRSRRDAARLVVSESDGAGELRV